MAIFSRSYSSTNLPGRWIEAEEITNWTIILRGELFLKIIRILCSRYKLLRNFNHAFLDESSKVLCTFIIAKITTLSNFPDQAGIPSIVLTIFVRSGLSGVILCITFAQLFPSTLAQRHSLQFLNVPGMYFAISSALFIESIGIVHFVYVLVASIKLLVCTRENSEQLRVSNSNSIEMQLLITSNLIPPSTDPGDHNQAADRIVQVGSRRRLLDNFLLYAKYIFSSILTLFSVFFIIYCTSMGYSSFNGSVAVQFSLLLIAMTIGFYCEGLKVAVISLSHVTDTTELISKGYTRSARTQALLIRCQPDGVNRFFLGRQLIVVPLGFIIAQITNFSGLPTEDIDGGLYGLLVNVGLPGILAMLQFAQLCPQLLSEEFSMAFMNLPGCFSLMCTSMVIEKLGLISFVWLLLAVVEKITSSPPKFINIISLSDTKERQKFILQSMEENNEIEDSKIHREIVPTK